MQQEKKPSPAIGLPPGIMWKNVVELHAPARFRHHWGDGIPPSGIMRSLLMLRRRIGVAIDLDEHKPCRVVLLLDDIEPGDAGFADAVARIFERGLFEGLDAFRFNAHMNMDNKHRFLSGRVRASPRRSAYRLTRP